MINTRKDAKRRELPPNRTMVSFWLAAELNYKAAKEAQRTGESKSEVMRQALEYYLGLPVHMRPKDA